MKDEESMDENKKITIKLLVDKKKNKVVFVESGEYFVQVLLCFISYPIGPISKRSSKNCMIGCLDSLYKSAEALDVQYFSSETSKENLLEPTWHCSTKVHCFSEMYPNHKCATCQKTMNGVLPGEITGNFIITDDLCVKKVFFDTGLSILTFHGITDASAVEERTITVDRSQVLALLKRSLLSQTPITDVLLELKENNRCTKKIKSEPLDGGSHLLDQTVCDSIKNISVKLLIRKSEQKVLYAVVNDKFVDFLYSILVFPMETIVELFSGHSLIGCVDNLYKSEGTLGEEHPENFKRHPKKTFDLGGYVKGPATFMVTDELVIQPFSPISSINFISELGVPLSDLEERIAHFGEQEALSVIKASLTTNAALTSVFCQKH